MKKINQQTMSLQLDTMLLPGEASLCPVYCIFKDTGFLSIGAITYWGFVTCTSGGRLLIAKSFINDCTRAACVLSQAKSLKIQKAPFGQYIITATFNNGKKDVKLRFQIAPKIAGCSFPDQSQNLETLLSILRNYETDR